MSCIRYKVCTLYQDVFVDHPVKKSFIILLSTVCYFCFQIFIPSKLMIGDWLRRFLRLIEAKTKWKRRIDTGDVVDKKMPGYEAKFAHPLMKRHECPICLFAMRNPVQTECGHLFCKECLSPLLRGRRPICPLDQEAISQDGVSHMHTVTVNAEILPIHLIWRFGDEQLNRQI